MSSFCPVHFGTLESCDSWCFDARARFVVAAADLERHWIIKYGHEKASAPRHQQHTPSYLEYVATVINRRSVA